jgi:hypothetical protein
MRPMRRPFGVGRSLMDPETRVKHGRGQYPARQSSLFAYLPPSPWHGSKGIRLITCEKWQANSTSFGASFCRRIVISENISGGDRDRGARLDRLCDIFITSPLVPQRLDLIAYHPNERLDRKHLRPQSGQLAKRPLSTNSLFKRVGFCTGAALS